MTWYAEHEDGHRLPTWVNAARGITYVADAPGRWTLVWENEPVDNLKGNPTDLHRDGTA